MRAEVRHQLKQDRFSQVTIEAAEKTVDWSAHHKTVLVAVVVVALLVAGAGFGAWYHFNQQDQLASLELGQGVRILDSPVRPANMPPQPDYPSYASSKERASEARTKFEAIVDHYPHTHSADIARYFLGVTDADLGDNAAASRELQSATQSRDADFAALAKLALASVYRNQSQNKQAIDLYKDLIAKPTTTVSKATAQMELADAYLADQQPLEAKRVYEQVQKENPATQAAQLASEKLEAVK